MKNVIKTLWSMLRGAFEVLRMVSVAFLLFFGIVYDYSRKGRIGRKAAKVINRHVKVPFKVNHVHMDNRIEVGDGYDVHLVHPHFPDMIFFVECDNHGKFDVEAFLKSYDGYLKELRM